MDKIIVDNPTSDIKLIHPFKDMLPDVDEFFMSESKKTVINTINALCYRIKLLSEKYKTQIDPDDFKGDALELFSEYLIKSNSTDNRIGIYEYSPIEKTDDVGVDGHNFLPWSWTEIQAEMVNRADNLNLVRKDNIGTTGNIFSVVDTETESA